MKQDQWRRLGMIGLVIMALLALFYVFTRYRQAKKERDVPLDDRPGY